MKFKHQAHSTLAEYEDLPPVFDETLWNVTIEDVLVKRISKAYGNDDKDPYLETKRLTQQKY